MQRYINSQGYKNEGYCISVNSLEQLSFFYLNQALSIEDEIDIRSFTKQNIPEAYLPIALDSSDNPITINLNEGDDYGKIVVFELDFEGDGHVIANSLEALLGVNNIDEF